MLEFGGWSGGAGDAGLVLDEALAVACGAGGVRLLSVQPAGKGAMDAAAFLNGRPVPKGTRLTA